MTRSDILNELQISRSVMNRWVVNHGFPRPLSLRIHRFKMWDRESVYRWVNQNTRVRRTLKDTQ